MTGEELQIDPDLDEEAVHLEGDQLVPDPQEKKLMVETSAEVCVHIIYIYFTCQVPQIIRCFLAYFKSDIFIFATPGTRESWIGGCRPGGRRTILFRFRIPRTQ